MIRSEAARYGTQIAKAEVIGLIPRAALMDAAQWYLQLDGLQAKQILEDKLALLEQQSQATEANTTFLDSLAAGTAAPGGGAAAAYSGAMAAALVAMVARLTTSNKRYAHVAAQMENIRNEAETLRATLTASVAADCAAFTAVMQAYTLPRGSASEATTRANAIEQALHGATIVPLQVARDSARVLELAASVAEQGNRNAVSDAGTAANLAVAAVHSAAFNVCTNAAAVKDREVAHNWLAEITALEDQARARSETIRHLVDNRLGPSTESGALNEGELLS
jgi:glutamate formiminotransferase/formiminotetrahydrofolate cyclodeaminase